MKKKVLAIILALYTVLGAIWYFNLKNKKEEIKEYSYNLDYLTVEIFGAVVFPGEYKVPLGYVVSDLLELAGGPKSDASLEGLNLAKTLENNQKIEILRSVTSKVIRLNLNTATFTELITVPGITEKRAASILVYREANGKFKSVLDLINVKNIGSVTLDQIKDYFYI